jgi:hypothetical protein
MAERRRRGFETSQNTGNPLDDYDPKYLERQGTRGDSGSIAAVRGIPAGWPFCECGNNNCPDREIKR